MTTKPNLTAEDHDILMQAMLGAAKEEYVIEQTMKDEEEARRYVEEREDSIRKGARRAEKRFRS